MAADQAAGLRQRRADRAARRLCLVSPALAPTRQLVPALARRGLRALMIDTGGRHFAQLPRSLFDWRRQLADGNLQTAAIPGGEAWLAPGVDAETPDLATVAARYDWLIFDASPSAVNVLAYLATADVLVLDVGHATLDPAYRMLKTLAHAGWGGEPVLLGESAACRRVEAACRQFLGVAFAQKIGNLAGEADAIAALAGRMAGEETRPRVVA